MKKSGDVLALNIGSDLLGDLNKGFNIVEAGLRISGENSEGLETGAVGFKKIHVRDNLLGVSDNSSDIASLNSGGKSLNVRNSLLDLSKAGRDVSGEDSLVRN